MNVELWQTVDRCFRENNIAGAASHMEKLLRASDSDRFTSLAEGQFTNWRRTVLDALNAFIVACGAEFDVQAVYLEMNGFDANYDRWYFDSFAYTIYGEDPDDLQWLCEWASPDWPQLTLTGLEGVQADFRWYMENRIYDRKTHYAVKELAVLLVMVRFVQLIENAIGSGGLAKRVPVLATAHDFDIVARFVPR